MSTSLLPSQFVLSIWITVAVQCLRLSMDLIQVASDATTRKDENGETSSTRSTAQIAPDNSRSVLFQSSESKEYGSMDTKDEESQTPLLQAGKAPRSTEDRNLPTSTSTPRLHLTVQFLCAWMFLAMTIMPPNDNSSNNNTRHFLVWAAGWSLLEWYISFRDPGRLRYGRFQRLLRWVAVIFLTLAALATVLQIIAGVTVVILLASVLYDDGYSVPRRKRHVDAMGTTTSTPTTTLDSDAMTTLLKPYFWPDATTSTAFWNRVRAISTWLFLVASKACDLTAPIMVGRASTALAHQDYATTVRYSIFYATLVFLGVVFNEAKSLVYLRVAQAAFVQLSEAAFDHLHHLSLDWHLRKKLGEVLRGVDRGIIACDTVMKYLFMWLVPAFGECLVVTIIFATYFQYLPLALSVFSFVFAYIVWTILVTLWRKQFRESLVSSDNEWHDRFTDSLINYETIKFFTAEKYEKARFAQAVNQYQSGSVNVQASLSFLNISQQMLLQICMAMALGLTAMGIKQRLDCCVETMGCESGVSECCQSIDAQVCPGMQVGDFVAVLSYIVSLFAPLNFLGSMYNAVLMGVIDLGTLSEIFWERPDVTDAKDAVALPRCPPPPAKGEKAVVVEFDNVFFRYSSQPESRGLKGVSFQMKQGTTTAIVGKTGAGKTSIARLLFRFYDVLGGAVKVNGMDVRSVTQESLRQAIGVVPQSASMFNDSLRANLRYGKLDATDKELRQAARDAQLLGFIESLDDGWETLVGDRGLLLSGGEKQRAAIARCLLKNPSIVILDEATSALDTLTEKSVQKALDRLGEHRTVLVIAHRLGTIRHADNILVLEDGRVVEQGTHDELLARNGVYAEMWETQLHSTSSSRVSQSSSLG